MGNIMKNVVFNYIVCAVAIAVLVMEIYFILKRNRKIKLKGKDDFFTFTLVVLFIMLIFPLSEMDSMLENIRNILILVAVFGTVGVKRGFSEKGFEKLGFTIAWDDVESFYIDAYQTNKIKVTCKTKKGHKFKLLFGKFRLKEVLRQIQAHTRNVYMQNSLDDVLKVKDLSGGRKKK